MGYKEHIIPYEGNEYKVGKSANNDGDNVNNIDVYRI